MLSDYKGIYKKAYEYYFRWEKDLLPLCALHYLYKKIVNFIESDLKQQLIGVSGQGKESKQNNYSHRQIVIAYEVMKIPITSENASDFLKKHSKTISTEKLLSKRIRNTNDLTKLSENKTTDTKKLKDLKKAKRLISGMKKEWKNENAITDIDRIITAFDTSYNIKY